LLDVIEEGRPAEAGPKRKTGPAYTEEFEEKFWKPYPRTPIMSKKEAFDVWVKLTPEDRALAIAAVPKYLAFLKSKPDHPAIHACRFLSKRRFDGLTDKPETTAATLPAKHLERRYGRVRLVSDTPEWRAWEAYHRAACTVMPPPDRDGGWYFSSEKPPLLPDQAKAIAA
jgi:hypothetical protein